MKTFTAWRPSFGSRHLWLYSKLKLLWCSYTIQTSIPSSHSSIFDLDERKRSDGGVLDGYLFANLAVIVVDSSEEGRASPQTPYNKH